MASTEFDVFANLQLDSERDILQLPQNTQHHDQATSTIALRFSQRLIDPLQGYRFGRDEKKNDVVLRKPGISAVHFRIGFNWTNGQLTITDTSSSHTIIESFNGEVKHLRQKSTPIFSNDIVQVALIRFKLVVPCHDEEAYNKKWEAHRQHALASLPSLNGLAIRRDLSLTMQDSAQLTLLPQKEGELSVIQKAVDCWGTFYAVKRWSKEEGRQIRELFHVKHIPSTL